MLVTNRKGRPMSRFLRPAALSLLPAALLAAALFFLQPAASLPALGQAELPIYGWTVCGDAGIGPVPGVGNVQRVDLCQGSGWEVRAYCLDPGKPVPAVGTVCSMVNSTDFWCGDSVQQLREFQILQTPAPPTPAPSATPITPQPSLTPQPPTATSAPPTPNAPAPSATPQPTLFVRPRPGGPGNLLVVLSAATIAWGAVILGAAILLLRRRSGNPGHGR